MNHVELIGIAGSGKSTVARAVRERNEEVYSLNELYGSIVAELLFPGKTAQLGSRLPLKGLSYLARITGLSDRGVNYCTLKYPQMVQHTAGAIETYTDDPARVDYIAGAMLDLIEQFGIVEEYTTGSQTLLIDEGFAFKSGSIYHPTQYSRRCTPEELRAYVSTLPVPDLLVFVRADPETCLERMRQRESGFPESWTRLESESYRTFATEAVSVAESITEAFDARGTEIVEVHTDRQPIGQSAFEIETRLDALDGE